MDDDYKPYEMALNKADPTKVIQNLDIYQAFDEKFNEAKKSLQESSNSEVTIEKLCELKAFCKDNFSKRENKFDFESIIPEIMEIITSSEPEIAIIWLKILNEFDSQYHSLISKYTNNFLYEFPKNLLETQNIDQEYMKPLLKSMISGIKNYNSDNSHETFDFSLIPINFDDDIDVSYLLRYLELIEILFQKNWEILTEINKIISNIVRIYYIFKDTSIELEYDLFYDVCYKIIQILFFKVRKSQEIMKNEQIIDILHEICNKYLFYDETSNNILIIHFILSLFVEMMRNDIEFSCNILPGLVSLDELVEFFIFMDEQVQRLILCIFLHLLRQKPDFINNDQVQRLILYVLPQFENIIHFNLKKLYLPIVYELAKNWSVNDTFVSQIILGNSENKIFFIEFIPDLIDMEDPEITKESVQIALIAIQKKPELIEYFQNLFQECLENDREELDTLREALKFE